MKLLVAVSGGVDSVVLLDMLVRQSKYELVVAHFDHGIRKDSAEDARFVAALAKQYGLLFETRREELGAHASEDLARTRRYAFLHELAAKHGAIVTAGHHMNDIAETIAINVTRGTGWRGIACLASDIYRPLLGVTKAEILQYAESRELAWREDSTNTSGQYLRNRLRPQLTDEDTVLQLAALRMRQIELRSEIEQEVARLLAADTLERHLFVMVDSVVASELLRYATKGRLTRPQRDRALLATKTARPGTVFEAGAGVSLHFTSRHFTVRVVQ